MNSSPSQTPDYANHSRRGARTGIVLILIPFGAIAGFILAILLEVAIGTFAGVIFSAADPGDPAIFMWLASLPGLGALAGAVLAPVLYVAAASRRQRK